MKIKRPSKIGIVALLLTAVLTTALGYVLLEKQVSMPGYIRASFNMKVLDIDHLTELSAIDLGGLTKGAIDAMPKAFPWDTEMYLPVYWDASENYYYLNNTNEMDFYLGFTVENAPANMLFTIAICRGNNTFGGFWRGTIDTNSPTTVVYPIGVIRGRLNATTPAESFVYWYLGVLPLHEAIGESYFTATLVFKALDSPTG